MPIYEYQCDACGQCFEKLCLGSDDKKQFECPSCGSANTHKLMSCTSFMGGGKGGLCSPASSSGFS